MAKYKYILSNNTFVNPYTFASVDFKESNRKEPEKGNLTGYISCTLTARTPLAILDTEKATEENGHKTYPFFRDVEGNPAIPASSIRGVVRNVYETLTNSCFSTLTREQRITARSNKPGEAGLLIKTGDKWDLYKAERKKLPKEKVKYENEPYVQVSEEKYYSGQEVSFFEEGALKCRICKKNERGSRKGILVIGEKIRNKENESVFIQSQKIKCAEETLNKAIRGLDEVFNIYNDETINRNLGKRPEAHKGYPRYKKNKENGTIPVWIKQDGGKLYLSLAAIGRISYEKSLNDLVVEKASCNNRKKSCPACRVFGMMGEESMGSKVRFSDAVEEKVILRPNKVTLTELGSPKASYLPFYANVSESDFDGKRNNLVSYDENRREIRGRKFYWHSKNFDIVNKNVERSKRNSTVEVCEEGSKFTFNIFFNSLTEEELKTLSFVLNLEEKGSDICFKIGHGKPIGLGSAKIEISDIIIRNFEDATYNLKSKKEDYCSNEKPNLVKKNILQEIIYIMDFNNSSMNVRYPYVVFNSTGEKIGPNDIAAHKWFYENKSARMKGHNHNIQLLPKIVAQNGSYVKQEMVAVEPKKDDSNYQSKNKRNNHGGYNGRRRK